MSKTRWAFVGGLLVVVGLAAARDALAAKTVLRLRVDGRLTEGSTGAAGLMAMFQNQPITNLREWVTTVRQAATDREIAGLLLIIEQPEANLAQIEEMTRALQAFRARGKPVLCYLDEAHNSTYALACAADHITLAENSELGIVGLQSELMYFKGLMDKLGLEMDMLHCGAYKSAHEPFTRTAPSPEAAENMNWLLDGLYDRWIALIAQGRKLAPEEVRRLVDRAPLTAAEALQSKLVDAVGSFATFSERVRREFGADVKVLKKYDREPQEKLDMSNPFAFFEFFTRLLEGVAEPTAPGIGLIYIEGAIVTGESDEDPLSLEASAGSTTLRAAFEKARTDDKIKAVVVRVDSPGGSALASDIIWEAATRCAAVKPLIVSMGGVAGSGGYYVAIPGHTVLAEASTITGSIGVVGGKLVLAGLLEDKLGITTTAFARGARAGLMSSTRRWTDDERAAMTRFINDVYAQFKNRVLKSRGERLKKDLEQIAGGRVYTGQQALELGLVDQLGGLHEALELAAGRAGLGRDYEVYVLPKASELEQLLAVLSKLSGQDGDDEFEVRAVAGRDPLLRAALPLLGRLAPAQARELRRALTQLALLQRERVGCFMPAVPIVR